MSWIFLWLEAIRKNAAVQTNHRLDPWNSVDPWNPGCPIERLIGGFTGGGADQLTCSCSLDWSLPSLLYQISFYKLSVNNHILERKRPRVIREHTQDALLRTTDGHKSRPFPSPAAAQWIQRSPLPSWVQDPPRSSRALPASHWGDPSFAWRSRWH